MDHFGIGAAIEGAVRIYLRSARGTGRTTSLVESVKNGDRLVFSDSREAERVRHLCEERGLKVECVVIDPKYPQRIFERGSSQGRTIFDHSWIEEYYLNVIDKAQKEIDHLEKESSGYGAAHRETKRRAIEISKWNV